MGALPRPSGPRALWRDFKAFINTEQRYRWIGVALAIFMPALMLAGFYVDSKKDPPKQQTYYVQSWPADRPDSVIIAQNRVDQAKKDARLAERQRQFKKVAKDLGIE